MLTLLTALDVFTAYLVPIPKQTLNGKLSQILGMNFCFEPEFADLSSGSPLHFTVWDRLIFSAYWSQRSLLLNVRNGEHGYGNSKSVWLAFTFPMNLIVNFAFRIWVYIWL